MAYSLTRFLKYIWEISGRLIALYSFLKSKLIKNNSIVHSVCDYALLYLIRSIKYVEPNVNYQLNLKLSIEQTGELISFQGIDSVISETEHFIRKLNQISFAMSRTDMNKLISSSLDLSSHKRSTTTTTVNLQQLIYC
ncbi:unnamed protein product [Rotaria sp. Silwood1]|nr:unnamed protein product [Rotaria sp. Silwood1]CAF4896921.1 unnamed protein product [Rotaria sp. Silwood1]CAF4970875.1 unnamed protein product [Rotaria sp. Silwood1]